MSKKGIKERMRVGRKEIPISPDFDKEGMKEAKKLWINSENQVRTLSQNPLLPFSLYADSRLPQERPQPLVPEIERVAIPTQEGILGELIPR